MGINSGNLSGNWRELQERLRIEQNHAQKKPSLNQNKELARDGSPNCQDDGRLRDKKQPLKRKSSLSKMAQVSKRSKILRSVSNVSVDPDPVDQSTQKSHSLDGGASNGHCKVVDRLHSASRSSLPTRKIGKYLALDTEMVGTLVPPAHSLPPSRHPPYTYSILARVSLVTYDLEQVYDAYVFPPPNTPITDYRTEHSGITGWHLDPGNKITEPKKFEKVQQEVHDLLRDRVLVGHDLSGDLAVLGLSHPRRDIRDTAFLPKFRAMAAGINPATTTNIGGLSRREGGLGRKDSAANVRARDHGLPLAGKKPSLRLLASEILGWEIQAAGKYGHDSVEDARAAMAVFQRVKRDFEKEVERRFGAVGVGKNLAKAPACSESGTQSAEESKYVANTDNVMTPEIVIGDSDYDDGHGDGTSFSNVLKEEVGVEHEARRPVASKESLRKKKKKKKKKGKYRRAHG